jgi:beta-mannosidase
MKYVVVILVSVLLVACKNQSKQNQSISLPQNWEFKEVGKNTWYPAKVPGEVHLDLLNNNLIDDPFFENNELKLQWVGASNWQYRSNFTLSAEQLQNEFIELDCRGVDTYAEVKVNGYVVLKTDNMFRSWQTNLKKHLKVGDNRIEILFQSPLTYNDSIVKAYPYQLPSGSESVPLKVGSFTRKAAYHFGWDWAPRYLTAGIWRPIYLNFWNEVRLKHINCQTVSISDSLAKVLVEIELEASQSSNNKFTLSINDEKNGLDVVKGVNIIRDTLSILNPKVWWTNGLGDPNLYTVSVRIHDKELVIDSLSQRFGVRTIELVNEPDSIGTSFYFLLNGKPVFMKGANYIPQDVFLPRVGDGHYKRLVSQAKSANMNMLRVWGGGIYENDIFYDLCDENGILVWQDFMFAGSLYPNHPAFIETVKLEISENIKRLRTHPCIAVWCGNNEIEVAWKNWGWQQQYGYTATDSVELWRDYLAMFHDLIPSIVHQYHASGNYTSTSPLSNWGTAENFNHESMHYWGVWHGKDNFEAFEDNVGRFMVEYGFQSFPSLKTLKNTMHDSSLYLTSDVVTNRQKSYIGNQEITRQIEKYYGQVSNFEAYIESSQKIQALAYQIAIQAHLNNRPHCMGTLFWQLNDCWPGPSWSVIAYDGSEKVAYQTVSDLYQE